MKINKILKITLIILIIVLLSMVSFVGLFIQNKNEYANILPEYKLGMDLSGYRKIVLEVSNDTEKINYDAQGNIIPAEDTTTEVANSEDKKVNPEEMLNENNFKNAKKIIENRLKEMQIEEYIISQDLQTGSIVLKVPENNMTDRVVAQVEMQGKFEIIDVDTNEVLMNNDDLKSVKSGYGTSASGATGIFINIQFNKQGTEKFKDITNKYIKTTIPKENEEGETTTETITKQIAIKVDGDKLLETYFDGEISNGLMQLTIGSSSSSTTEELQEYLVEAMSMATLLDSGNMPIIYEATQNKYVFSDLTTKELLPGLYIGLVILAILIIYIIVKYKKMGVLSAISLIGYIATLLIIIRYTNVVITISSIIAIVLSIIINYAMLLMFMKNIEKLEKNEIKFSKILSKYMISIIPVVIIAITFCFAGNVSVFSFGMVIFWGLVVTLLYNIIITKSLIINKN